MRVRLFFTSVLLTLVAVSAVHAQEEQSNNDDRLLLPPLAAPSAEAPSGLEEGNDTPPTTQDEDQKKPAPYEYPQPHMFKHPIQVGPDQLRHHSGYWQPGGYQVRDGSPFFNSVPGAPPRGPIAGGGGDSGYNPSPAAGFFPPLEQALSPLSPLFPGQNYGRNPAMNTPVQTYAPQGYTANTPADPHTSYSNAGSIPQYQGYYVPQQAPAGGVSGNTAPGNMATGNPVNNAAGGASAGPGGDPYNYHFGPGYYRNSEYGHFRFPYYSYRRPWFHPGFPGFNRDTNIPW